VSVDCTVTVARLRIVTEGVGRMVLMSRDLMDVVVVRRVGVGRVNIDVLNCVLVVRA